MIVGAIVSAAYGVIFYLITDIRREIIAVIGAIIGSVAGMYAAKSACDATLRDYSGKAVCIFFEVIIAVSLIGDTLSKFEWLTIIAIAHDLAAAPTAFILFWKRTTELQPTAGKLTVYRNRRPETDPIKLLMKQAAKMKWKQTAEVREDGQGFAWTQRSVRFARGKEEAVLWYKDATITLVRDCAPPTFDDFIELEQWIKRNPRDTEVDTATGERLYQREIERFVIRHGHFLPLLEATATDKAFFMAVATFHALGTSPEKLRR